MLLAEAEADPEAADLEADEAPELEARVEEATESVEVTTEDVAETETVEVPCSTVMYVPATREPMPLSDKYEDKSKVETPMFSVYPSGEVKVEGC